MIKFNLTYKNILLLIPIITLIIWFSFKKINNEPIIKEKINLNKYTNDNLDIDYKKYPKINDCIFVSIGSYRDDECPLTIKSLYDNADEPEKIFIGVCSQNKENNEECLDNNYKYKKQIRIKRLSYKDALGPQYARYLCSHLWRGEEYYLQIDSHLVFKKSWDTIIKNMYKKLPNKSVLTHYPPSKIDSDPSYTCSSHFENNFHIISEAKITNFDKPIITPYFSAGLMFVDSNFLYNISYDPYLPYLFQGEEVLMAIRFYTNGWNLYNLSEPIATHNYGRNDKPHFWSDHKHIDWRKIQKESHKRYYKIIKQGEDILPIFNKKIEKYGLGNIRTVEDFFKFAGIDFKNKKVESRCDKKYDIKTNTWIKK